MKMIRILSAKVAILGLFCGVGSARAATCTSPSDVSAASTSSYVPLDNAGTDTIRGTATSQVIDFRTFVFSNSVPSQTMIAGLFIYRDNTSPNKPNLLSQSSWRMAGYQSTSFAGFKIFDFQNVQLTSLEIEEGGLARYRGAIGWDQACDQNGNPAPSGQPLMDGISTNIGIAYGAPSLGVLPAGHGVLVGADLHSGVIADIDPKPSDAGTHEYLGLNRAEFDPFSNGTGALDETTRYYRSVNVDTTLSVQDSINACLAGIVNACISCGGCAACQNAIENCEDNEDNSIEAELPTLQAFRDRYFPAGINQTTTQPNIGKEIVTKYYNNGDLGIGREMHCNFGLNDDQTPNDDVTDNERACYVFNYSPCRQGGVAFNGRCEAPVFGDEAGSIAAQQNGDVPFAAVAMVERERLRGQPNQTFFAVYACGNNDCDDLNQHFLFAGEVALDNHGVDAVVDLGSAHQSNLFNPGNCMSCHGGGGEYVPASTQPDGSAARDAATTGAAFLPFDMDVLTFFSGSTFSDNHDRMREMNREIAENGMIRDMGNARDVIETWYGGPNYPHQFNGYRVPDSFAGSNPTPQDSAIYTELYADGCRGCHLTQPNLQLATASEWKLGGTVGPAFVQERICNSEIMPLAERTQDIVWESQYRQKLIQLLGISDAECSTN